MCLAQEDVRFQPMAPQSRVKYSTTEALRYLVIVFVGVVVIGLDVAFSSFYNGTAPRS